MQKLTSLLMLLSSLLVGQVTHAANISFGTSEYITIRDCIPGASGCDGTGPRLFGEYGGLPGDAASSANIDVLGFGSGSGSVALSGVVGEPLIKASAFSQQGKRVNTNSAALQRYVYSGAAATTRTFGGTLTYSQLSTGAYPFEAGAGISAILEIFTLPTSTITIEDSAEANFLMLFGGFGSLDGYVSLAAGSYADAASTEFGIGNVAVTVNLNPGDAIWVWALVQTPAVNGGWIDASHTLITSWNDPVGLAPAVVAVPEPGTLLLWSSGFLTILAHVARRRRLSRSNFCAMATAMMLK